nr:uncharacterized protein LOC113815642 isoform X1 [Penaeus vannamei]
MGDKIWPVTRIPSIFDSDDDSDEDLSNPTPSAILTSQVQSNTSTAFSEEYPAHSQASNEQDTGKDVSGGKDIEKGCREEQEPETFVSCGQESKEIEDGRQTPLEDQGGDLQATEIVKGIEDHEEVCEEDTSVERVYNTEETDSKEEEIEKIAPSVQEVDQGQSICSDLNKSSSEPGRSGDKEVIEEELDKSFSSFDNVEGSDSDDINKGNQSISSHDNIDDGSEEDAAGGDDKSISSHDNLDEASEGEDADMEVDKSTASHDNIGEISEEDTGEIANKSVSSHDHADEASEDADMEVDKSMSSHSNADEVSEADDAMDKSVSSHDNVEIGSDDSEDKHDVAIGDNELDISLSSHGNADEQSDGDVNDSHLGYESEGEKNAEHHVDADKEKLANERGSDRIDSPIEHDSKLKLAKEHCTSDSEEGPVEPKIEDDSVQVESKDVLSLSKEDKMEVSSQVFSHTVGEEYEVVTEKKEKDIEVEKGECTTDIQRDDRSPICKEETTPTEVEEVMEVDKDSDVLTAEKVPSCGKQETDQPETQTVFKTEQMNICERLDTKGDLGVQEEEKEAAEMEKKEKKVVEESPKWDASAEESEAESRDPDAQEPVLVKKFSESIYSDSETEDVMDVEAENEPKVAGVTSGTGRVPVRVEDVYTDSEDEGTRDSQPQVGSKGCETSVTSETDSVDPEEQKDSLYVDAAAKESRSATPQLSVIEALPPSSSKEDTNTTTPPSSEKKRHHKRRHESKKSFNLEACLKAFEQGWKREIVFRATVDPNKGGSRADIYYYAPFGKKLRSKVEIEDYLQRYGIQDLNLDNFTWVKAPLGVGEQYEQIRHASKSSTSSVRGKTSTPNQVGVVTPSVTPGSSPKTPSSVEVKNPRKRGRPPKQVAEKPPKRARMKITPIIPLKLKKQLDNSKNITPAAPGPTDTSASESQATFPSNWNSNSNSAAVTTSQLGEAAPAKSAVPSKSRQNHIVYSTKVCESLGASMKILTPMLSGDICMRTFHCTNFCPLGGGTVPSLQCIKCLCLFHPECTYMPPATATIIQTGGAKFLCPNCYRENKENVGANQWTPPKPYEPLAYDPPWESEEEDDNKPDQEIIANNYIRVSIKEHHQSVLPSHLAGVSRSQHSDALGQTTSAAAYSTGSTQPPVFTTDSQGLQGTLTVNASGMIGGLPPNLPNGQLVQIQSPGSVPTRFLLVRANTNEMQPVQMPPLQMGMPRGIILPQNMIGGQPMPVMLPSNQSRYPGPHMVQQSGMRATEEYENVKAVEAPKKQEFLRELSQSYRLLLHVFKYLSVKDLLVASCVCVMWRDLAYSSSLWGTVRLRNVCVRDWAQLARFMERRNVRNIDLRKMIFRHPVPERLEHTLHRSEVSKSPSKDVTSVEPTSARSSYIPETSSSRNGSPVSRQSEGFRISPQKDKLIKDQVKGLTLDDDSSVKKLENPVNTKLEKRDAVGEVQPEVKKQKLQKKTDAACETSDTTSTSEEAMEITEEEDSRDDKETCKKDRIEADSDGHAKRTSAASLDADSDRRPSQENECIEDNDTNTSKIKDIHPRTEGGCRRIEKDIWDDICGAMGSIHCLRGVILPTCRAEVLQLLLTRCKHLISVTATELREPSGISKFDPAYLMEVPHLEELRLGSTQNFLLTSNFNFIKLQKLKVLVMRGFSGSNWPYLGTNLTHLQVGPVSNFSNLTWNNIGSMTNLEALWLEDGGSLNDIAIFEALSRLSNLRRLCLFNFAVGPKLGQALKKLTKLERVFVLPVSSQQANIGVQNGNMLAVTETMRHVDELVWAVRSQDIQLFSQVEHIHMCPSKTKAYTGFTNSDDAMANLWTLQRLETIVKRHLPRTRVRILKLDAAAAARMAMSTL